MIHERSKSSRSEITKKATFASWEKYALLMVWGNSNNSNYNDWRNFWNY